MARKSIFSREEIIEKAFEFVRTKGIENLTVRNLAKQLNISTGPLFVAFKNFEEIENLTKRKAKDFYREKYLNEALKKEPPFKWIGYNYIKFAKDEPNLFRIVFDDVDEKNQSGFLPSYDENNKTVYSTIESSYNFLEGKAKKIYNHLSVYCYGLANLFASGSCIFTMEDVSKMLTEIFVALKENIK